MESNIGYHHGAQRMAEDLGFTDRDQLEEWARRNPDIWGNHAGNQMFGSTGIAFTSSKRPEGAKSLNNIIQHWKEVRDRLVAIEEKEKEEIEYPDITEELAKLPVEETPDMVKKTEKPRIW